MNPATTTVPMDEPAVVGSSLSQALVAPETEHKTWYTVEYGLRSDDVAGVIHFFRPEGKSWRPDFPEKLKAAVDAILDTKRVSADYVPDLDSFCVRVGLTDVENPWDALDSLLEELDRRLES